MGVINDGTMLHVDVLRAISLQLRDVNGGIIYMPVVDVDGCVRTYYGDACLIIGPDGQMVGTGCHSGYHYFDMSDPNLIKAIRIWLKNCE